MIAAPLTNHLLAAVMAPKVISEEERAGVMGEWSLVPMGRLDLLHSRLFKIRAGVSSMLHMILPQGVLCATAFVAPRGELAIPIPILSFTLL